MKFVCHKNALQKEIALALDFTSQRNTLSVVSYVLLEAKNNKLTIKATDQKVGFTSTIDVEVHQEGSTTVYCEKFFSILRSLPDENVVFEEKGQRLFIQPETKTIDFDLRTIEVDKFPSLEEASQVVEFSLAQKDLFEMIDQTIFSISDDETRHFMNGAYIEQQPNALVMVATDGRRLSYIKRNIEQDVPSFVPITIPTRFLHLMKKSGTGEGEVVLGIKENLLFASFGHQTMYTTLIHGTFPNYKRVIPEKQTLSCVASIDDMNEALKRVSLLVENKAKRIFVELNQNQMIISSEESEFGQAKEVIACTYDGPATSFAMNYLYMVSPLRVMEGKMFSFCFTEPNKAITVRPDPEKDYFHIIMPMQID